MEDDKPSPQRPSVFDGADPEQITNEFLLAIFLPGIVTLAALWVVFRLFLGGALSSLGLVQITPDPMPFVAIEGGYGRFFLLIVLTTLVLLVYFVFYLRVLRRRLIDRGIV